MRTLLGILLLGFMLCGLTVLVAQPPVHGPEPPEGWFCAHDADTPADHVCDCQRECIKKQDCDEDGNCTELPGLEVREDSKCKVYCHKEHCTCPVKNCNSTEHDHVR